MIITSHSDTWNGGGNLYYFVDGINENSTSKIPLNDPCKLVAGGKWRMPSLEDFESLGVYMVHNGGDINGTTDGLPTTTLSGERTMLTEILPVIIFRTSILKEYKRLPEQVQD